MIPEDKNVLSVRELTVDDVPLIVKYWLESDPDYLTGMGVDLTKLPAATDFSQMLIRQVNLPHAEKKSFCVIWLINEKPVGHSNLNPFLFGEWGTMHLHLWNAEHRAIGYGVTFLRKTLPLFFNTLNLHTLYCEPMAINEAPHKVLLKTGFTFLKEYLTTPGSINFEQVVKRWELKKSDFDRRYL